MRPRRREIMKNQYAANTPTPTAIRTRATVPPMMIVLEEVPRRDPDSAGVGEGLRVSDWEGVPVMEVERVPRAVVSVHESVML